MNMLVVHQWSSGLKPFLVIAAISVSLAVCARRSDNSWYVKATKDNTVTLYHDNKVFVARCKGGFAFLSEQGLIACPDLVEHVGETLPNGKQNQQISDGNNS